VATESDVYEIFTSMESYLTIREELERRGIPVAAKELAMIPQTYLEVEPGRAKQVRRPSRSGPREPRQC